ncbi:cation-translocating P-type ATPase [Oceanobacillus indicireducens]|uniref:Calcium-transporting ATPase n=1 Tax=Oceanobacillus indicireducens TaxID=1004261 RepID=A0A918CYG4_9BACI|nr:cation-translocating P-type ATPase [Oceanobacillus indicireducens]GGN49447.1 calcium-transporting ATPase [Oceanobacillus indicireducens]
MKWYQLDIDEVEKKLQVTIPQGITEEQVQARRKKFGANELDAQKKQSRWLLFLKQFQDFMVLVLLGATLIAGLLGEYVDAIAIMIIVLVNGCIGYFQEQKAEDSLEKIKQLSAPLSNVKRNGKWHKINSRELVAGDIVRIQSGDRIPADIRIVEANSLEIEESALTGESLPVAKIGQAMTETDLDPQDQLNMAFMGTLVTKGQGIGIVTRTGMQTEMGKIASLIMTTKKIMTPLERKLAELGKVLIIVAFLLTALVVILGILQGRPLYHMVLAGVSLAVAAIPEGLPAIVTVALSLGVQRMIKRKAIVRKLSSVETLGSASVICSDKTGTMTENQMTVKKLYLNGEFLHLTGEGYQVNGEILNGDQTVDGDHPNLDAMLRYGILCNQANLKLQDGQYTIDGDPVDGALLVAARKFGLNEAIKAEYQLVKEFPFDSERKRMSVVVEDENGRRFLIVKGAPDVLLPRSSFYLTKDGRKVLDLTGKDKFNQAIERMASDALRIIGIGMRPLQKGELLDDAAFLETEITFIGLYGMIDPPRKEVKPAILACRQAGIKTVMITGDHANTATAIAKELELLPESGRVVSGSELNQLNQQELEKQIEEIYVFARVTPEHKLRIVKAFQSRGHVVAMTGDGVNDAPSIKAADIGISMGISGTDVTKEASSLVLMDDNFATIKAAIDEGRNIYENIRKFIRYLLASNVGEILVMLFAVMLKMPLPLVPVQILWVNLVTDGLPAMALGMDTSEEDVMKRKPRNPREGIFARGLGYKIVSRGILIGLVSLIAFLFAYHNDPDNLTYARTMTFTTLVMAQLIHVFECRSEKSIFARNPFENKYLLFAVLSSVLLLLIVVYWPPLQPIFHTTALGVLDWLIVLVLSLLPTILFAYTKK